MLCAKKVARAHVIFAWYHVINRALQHSIKKLPTLNLINFCVDGVVKNETINYQAGRKIFVVVKEYLGLINRT